MSLRARLVTGVSVTLVLVIGLAVAVVAIQRDQLIGQLDDQLAAIAPLERPAPPRGDQASAGEQTAPGSGRQPISDVYLAAVALDGSVDVIVQGQLLTDAVDTSQLMGTVATQRSFTTLDSVDGSTTFRALVEPGPGVAAVVIAIPQTDVDQTIDRLIVMFALVAAAIALTLGAVAWWVWKLGIRPLADMTTTANAIAAGDRGQRAPELSNATEAGQLAEALNSMLDQRDGAEDRLRQFVSDASHELRTPLTSIRGYLELYSGGGFREAGELDDAVRRMTDESDRMAAMLEDLLHLARLDEEQPLLIEASDIGELVRDVCADASTARPRQVITADAPERGELVVPVDRRKLRQMLVGLVDNAAVHGADAPVEVSARSAGDSLVLAVTDDGPGLAADDALRVFDRFYRGDPSRTRATGGSGLGLAIAQSVAQRHGGTIELETELGDGCTFTIRIPCAGLEANAKQAPHD